MLVAYLGGKVVHFKVRGQSIVDVGSIDLEQEITCVGLAGNAQLACVSLFDAPLYSLVVLSLSDANIKKVEQRSLLSILENEAF